MRIARRTVNRHSVEDLTRHGVFVETLLIALEQFLLFDAVTSKNVLCAPFVYIVLCFHLYPSRSLSLSLSHVAPKHYFPSAKISTRATYICRLGVLCLTLSQQVIVNSSCLTLLYFYTVKSKYIDIYRFIFVQS